MSQWQRSGEAMPREMRITFVVKPEEHPELAQWLWSLPYRSTSKVVRQILSDAARASQSASGAHQSPATAPTRIPVAAPAPELSRSAPVAYSGAAPAATAPPAQDAAAPNTQMTQELASLLREMDSNF